MRLAWAAIAVVGLLSGSAASSAEPPPDVTYQGQLLTPAGPPQASPVNPQLRVDDGVGPDTGGTPSFAAGDPASAIPRVRDEVRGWIAAKGRARVLVAFSLPGSRRRIALARSASERAQVRSTARGILARLAPGEFEVTHEFEGLGALAGSVSEAGLARLLEDPAVYAVGLDRELHLALAESVPLVRLSALHTMGLTGAGSKVAILDTGLDRDHPDLAADLVDEACFCSTERGPCCPDGTGQQLGPGSAEDDDGHGTAVTGIVGSDGIVAPVGGAPDADLVVVRVSDRAGMAASDVLAAADWVWRNHPDTDVANLSFGTPDGLATPCDGYDATTAIAAIIVQTLKAQGMVVVASAMNNGRPNGLGIPACLSGVIAVGATYDAGPLVDQVTDFSNRDAAVALVAPGASIDTSGLGGGVWGFGGTSASAPLVSACAAVLRQAKPVATVDQLRAALTTSPTIVTDVVTGRRWPRLDCEAALAALPIDCAAGTDSDGDGRCGDADNCPYVANSTQDDVGGLGQDSPPDGIGDACQCGDVNGDGRITLADAVLLQRSLLQPPTETLTKPELCDVGGSTGCSLSDVVIIRRALLLPPTAATQQVCAPASP